MSSDSNGYQRRGRPPVQITAHEDDIAPVPTHNNSKDDYWYNPTPSIKDEYEDDVIPGPPLHFKSDKERSRSKSKGSSGGSIFTRILSVHKTPSSPKATQKKVDILQVSSTQHQWAGGGILASREDLELPAHEFAAGCNLLQAAARGDLTSCRKLLEERPNHVQFRDYDRRTALHVAASEGHLDICQYLVDECGARINRSDRWGGSPLDDAHRHRHLAVVKYLRDKGATTGSGNRSTNLITAAADGDADEVAMLLSSMNQMDLDASLSNEKDPAKIEEQSLPKVPSLSHAASTDLYSSQHNSVLDINKGDYDKRTTLHLAAGEGHLDVIRLLVEAGANVNVEDRWNRRPLDDALQGKHNECVNYLRSQGASRGTRKTISDSGRGLGSSKNSTTGAMVDSNMKIDFDELDMIDRIGSGAFGEIYKCRWRGTLVAAKIVKTAKIRREWYTKKNMDAIAKGTMNVDEAIMNIDEAEMNQQEKDLALSDFRQEIAVLKSLRHPHIVLMLAYSTTENYEVMISELMKCSLLDIFKTHIVTGTKMPRRKQITYATQLALGMMYLHTCDPPIIHRDLKPANLLIDHSGVLKISDFGLSKVRPDPAKKEMDQFRMTGETGSYRFMAPEVFRHEQYNELVDVYSFAMICFYLLVGRPPWPTLPGLTAVKKAAEEGDRPNIPRELDARLQTLLKECWDDNAMNRPSFSRITDVLTKYNADVFHQSENEVIGTSAPDFPKEILCNCAIL